MTLLAHGIGGVRDLPLPDWLFLWGGALVLVLSFLLLGTLWQRPKLERAQAGRPFPQRLEASLRSQAMRLLCGTVAVALLILVFLTALIGEPNPSFNLAPTFVYVIFWLGVVALQVVFGNVWSVLNPWRAAADGFAWLWGRLGLTWTPVLAYPERLGVFPAAASLFAYTVLELTYFEPSDPRALALAIAVYSYVTWFGMAAFGRREWTEHGEGFTVYFELFARIAPFGSHDGRLVVRAPLTGLAGADRRPGLLPFVAIMLGSVAFDGVSRSRFWQDLRFGAQGGYVVDRPWLGDAVGMAVNLGGLVGTIVLIAVAYLAAVHLARAMAARRLPLVAEFLLGLVPIALVYVVAHYFTLLLVQGQFALLLASDPFGYGWDIFGIGGYQPNLAPIGPNTIWYLEVAALVLGHVAGLAVAHDRAITILPTRDALRSQYAMLTLMVVYTVGGLWLLSQN